MALVNVTSGITGSVWEITVSPGDSVGEDDTLLILESMKMEIPVMAPEDGVIHQIKVQEGDVVSEGDIVIILEV